MMNGLVVGKFYPPHRGHRYLIDTAVSKADVVTVLVVDGENEDPPAKLRAEWLREIHPNVHVHVIPDVRDDTNSALWAIHARAQLSSWESIYGLNPIIDKVFTSESYGETWADEIASQQGGPCENVFVGRKYIDISGTQIRNDPERYWKYIDAPVRAYYVKRVAVVGAESTGSTTLVKSLASAYDTIWVPEYGREYTVEKFSIGTGEQWTTSDFIRIAVEQQALEDRIAREAPVGIMFCDTDALATALWHEVYVSQGLQEPGGVDEIWNIANKRDYDLYILTNHDIPWENDGLRLGDNTRADMTKRFEEELTIRNMQQWIKVSGARPERLVQAVDAISDFYL